MATPGCHLPFLVRYAETLIRLLTLYFYCPLTILPFQLRSLVDPDGIRGAAAKTDIQVELAPYESVEVPDVFLVVRT